MENNITIPKHIGIIMDGNGRWAKKRMLPRNMGHKKGAEVFQDITRYCNQLGLEAVTFYAFSLMLLITKRKTTRLFFLATNLHSIRSCGI